MSIAPGTIVRITDPSAWWLADQTAHVFGAYLSNDGWTVYALEIDGNQIVMDIPEFDLDVVYVPKHMHVSDEPRYLTDGEVATLYSVELTQIMRAEAAAKARGMHRSQA